MLTTSGYETRKKGLCSKNKIRICCGLESIWPKLKKIVLICCKYRTQKSKSSLRNFISHMVYLLIMCPN